MRKGSVFTRESHAAANAQEHGAARPSPQHQYQPPYASAQPLSKKPVQQPPGAQYRRNMLRVQRGRTDSLPISRSLNSRCGSQFRHRSRQRHSPVHSAPLWHNRLSACRPVAAPQPEPVAELAPVMDKPKRKEAVIIMNVAAHHGSEAKR